MHPSPAPVHARQVLLATQVVFFVCVILCVGISPGGGSDVYGISYYGVHAPTLPLVAIGYGVGSVGLWRTAKYLAPLAQTRAIATGLRVVAISLPALLLTPFNHGSFFNWAHMSIGIVIGVTQMFIGTCLLVRRRRLWTTVAVILEFLGGIVAALSLPDWGFNHMLEGEMAFELGFSWCLILWTYALSTPTSAQHHFSSELS